ncbi:hypothetical protein SAMN05660909_03866 [Chitinophaga terrae (ex Kim and Jung 2007)]|uniref:Uncharacterized protein n=1 Tax=Chitinophaga terrae (ex Kim and Jung 2007) TaxID=408074 RepID=A0A1H4ENK8_9BACT|nr:hypothetical protein [Chitinophaga terrae (ex Kim and Jung 2007)]SEA86694.1 hypothetical protein SAMN05660909_03866 [Chitinophaga terrae (ex Kim and Jung 2007)]
MLFSVPGQGGGNGKAARKPNVNLIVYKLIDLLVYFYISLTLGAGIVLEKIDRLSPNKNCNVTFNVYTIQD